MAKAELLPSGNYRLRCYCGKNAEGKKIYKTFIESSPTACQKAERAWLKAGGIEDLMKVEVPKGPTVRQSIEAYAEKCRTSRTKIYSPATIYEYDKFAKACNEIIRDVHVEDITQEDLQDYVDVRSSEVAPKTIKNELYMLRPSIVNAGRRDLDFSALELPETEAKDYVIPTDDEIQSLLRAFQDDDQMLIAVVLGAFMGLRRSEVCALRWSDIDMTAGIMHIRHAVVLGYTRTFVEKETKTRAGKRDLILSAEVLEILKRRAMVDGKLYPDEYIVGLTPGALADRWKKVRDGLGYSFGFHALRHYHASVMLALDIPKAYAVADMGHASFYMIEKVYGQIIKEKEKATAHLVGNHAATLLRGDTFDWTSKKEDVGN